MIELIIWVCLWPLTVTICDALDSYSGSINPERKTSASDVHDSATLLCAIIWLVGGFIIAIANAVQL